MRRMLAVAGVTAVIVVAGCGGGTSGTDAKPEPTPITAPATRARGVVDQQNQQLQQMEQRAAQADPTVP